MLQFRQHIEQFQESVKCALVPQIVPFDTLPSFQLVIPWSTSDINTMVLVDYNGIEFPFGFINPSDLFEKRRSEGRDTYIFTERSGVLAVQDALDCACYRLKITMDDGDVWYSNLFQYSDLFTGLSDSPFLAIQWTNSCHTYPYFYEDGWTGTIFLDADVSYPQYVLEEEVEEDSEGVESVVSIISKKLHTVDINTGNEPLLDTFRAILLSDSVTVHTGLEGGVRISYSVIDKEISEPEISKETASFVFTFAEEDNIIKLGCCATGCPDHGFEVISIVDDGDFGSLTPTTGDSHFIASVSTGSSEFSDHLGEVASYDGTEWDYSHVPNNTYILVSGVLYLVNVDGYGDAFGNEVEVPSYVSSSSIVYGVIPEGTLVYTDSDDIFSSEEMEAGVVLGSGFHDFTVEDLNGCGTWDDTAQTIEVVGD